MGAKMNGLRWLKEGNWWALAVAIVLSGLLIWWQNYAAEQERIAKNSEPIENWIDFRSAHVPDFVQGDEGKTLVQLDMEFKQPITMHWTVEAASVTTEVRNFSCKASGVINTFKPGDTLPPDGVSLEFIFRSRPCKWTPGEFMINTEMEVHRDGYDTAIVSRSSNPFRVLPEGAQLYVTPEQVQKLENVEPEAALP